MTDFSTEPGLGPQGYPQGRELPALLPVQEETLELVAHLAAYSDMLVVVSGPDGSGKTLLAETLAERRHAADDALLLTANNMLGMPALLQQIAAHWQIQLPQELPAARELLSREALQRSEQGGHLLLMIDQAEQLDTETLNDIAHFALLAPPAISIVLFGQPGFEQALRGGPAQAQVQVQSLAPLNAAAAQQLLQRVYSPGQALPLSEKEFAFILQQSQGWPGALLMQAGDYFIAAEAADAPRQARAEPKAGGRFPLLHIVAIAALLAALGVSLLYRQQEPADDIITEPSEPVDFLRGPLPGETLSADNVQDTEVTPPDVLTLDNPPAAPAAEVADKVATTAGDSQPDYNFPASVQAPAPVAPVPPAVAPADVPEAAPAAAPAAVKPAPVAAPAPVAKAPVYDRSRLLDIPSGFVVQLFGSYEAANADKFRRQWRDEITGSLYLYETRHNNKPWFVVVAGVYGSRAEATAAVNALPRPLRDQSPWIRDISAVKQALR